MLFFTIFLLVFEKIGGGVGGGEGGGWSEGVLKHTTAPTKFQFFITKEHCSLHETNQL